MSSHLSWVWSPHSFDKCAVHFVKLSRLKLPKYGYLPLYTLWLLQSPSCIRSDQVWARITFGTFGPCMVLQKKLWMTCSQSLLGDPSKKIWKNLGFCPNWAEGEGGSANPKLLSNFSKTKFALELPINVMKYIIHRWGVDIFSIHVTIGPSQSSSQPKKNEIFREKNILGIA